MIQSKYIPGVEVPQFDGAVSDVVTDHGIDGGGTEMTIAVENLEGKAYRIITTVGMGAYLHATAGLLALGFKDLLADSIEGKNGYDSWFVVTPELLEMFPAQVELTSNPASDILGEIEKLGELPDTTREAVILSRVGQGKFRDQLVDYWKKCAVTEAECVPLLKASHIKPWRDANNEERLDPHNGLLLSPTIDAAFDAGYITFDANGKILLSRSIEGAAAYQLHISSKLRINSRLLTDQHRKYLEYHRTHVFRG